MSKATPEKFWAEVDKCQLLCKRCHKNKTISTIREGRHGQMLASRCHCEPCKIAKRLHLKLYMRQRRANLA